ncbi:hypothetical protein CcCBS67573_g00093 [Chytriomyces confervae]|uniref:Uncharacterized protein n=1 Tax=Chytriomyces confervae TaxID=246404 RepID=A0A507FQY5_9FUNG|nr:hypothetical protein CcCBS67573_g00093 [Chytriomyces confervae]
MDEHVVFKDANHRIEETVCEWLEPRLKRLLYLFAQCEPNAGDVSEKLLDSMTTCMPFENSTGVDCLASMISELTQLLALFHLKLVPQTFDFDRHVPNCAHAEQEWRLRRCHARFDLGRIPFGDWNADPEADSVRRAASASPFSDFSGDSNTGNNADDILDEASRFIQSPPAFLSMVLDTLHPIIFADDGCEKKNSEVDQDDVAAWDVLASLQCFCQDSVLKFGLNKPLTQEDTRLDRALTIIHILQNIKPPSSFSERIALSRASIKDQLLRQAIRVSFFSNPFIPFARSENIFSSIQDVVTAGSGAGEGDHDRECREALGSLMRPMPNREIIVKQIRTAVSNVAKARKLKSQSLSAASEVSKRAASAGFSASRSVETFDFPENPVAKVARLEDVVEDMSLNILQPEERISAWQKQIPESLGVVDGTDKMTALETYSNASVESVALPAMRTAMEGVEGPANDLKSEANEVVNSTVTEAVENVLPSSTDIQPTIEPTVSTSLSIKPNDAKLEIDTAAPVIALEVDKPISPIVIEDDTVEYKEGIEARAKVSRQEGEDRSSKSASTEPPANITDILDQNRSVVKMVGLVRNRMNSSADPEAEIKKLDQMMRTKGGFTVAKLERMYAILKQRGGVNFAGINPVPELSAESLCAMRLLTDTDKRLASESKSSSSKESPGQASSTASVVSKPPSKVAETLPDASRVGLPYSLGVDTTTAIPGVASTERIISRAHPDPVQTPTASTTSTATSTILPITPTVSQPETNVESTSSIHNVQTFGRNICKPAPILSSADQIVDLTFSPTESVVSVNGTSRSGSSSIPVAEARLNHMAFTPYLRSSPADTLSKMTPIPEEKRNSLKSPTLMEQRDLLAGGAKNLTNPLLTSAQHAAKFSAQNGKQDAMQTVSPLMQQPFLPQQLPQNPAVPQLAPITFTQSFSSPHSKYSSLPHHQKPVSVSDHAGFIPPPVQQEHSVSPHIRVIPTPHQQQSLSHPMVLTAHSTPARQPSAALSPTEAQITHQLRALLNAYATYPGVISSQQLEPLQTYYLVLTQRIAKGRVLNETENATLKDISTLLQMQRAREAEQQLQTLQQQQYQLMQKQQQVKQQQRLFEQQSQAQMLQMQQQQLQQQAHQNRLNQIHSQQQLQRQSQLYLNTHPHHQLIPPSHQPTNDLRLPTTFSNSSTAPGSVFTAGQLGNTAPLAKGGSAAIPSGGFLPKSQSIGPPVGILSVSPSFPPASAFSAPPSTSGVAGPPGQTQANTPIPNKGIQTVYPPNIPAAYYTEHWNRGEHLVEPVSTCANSESTEGSESAKSQRHILETHMTHTRRQRETIGALAFRNVANRVGEQLNVWDKFVKNGAPAGSNGNIVVPPGFVGFEEGDDEVK